MENKQEEKKDDGNWDVIDDDDEREHEEDKAKEVKKEEIKAERVCIEGILFTFLCLFVFIKYKTVQFGNITNRVTDRPSYYTKYDVASQANP